MPTVVTGHARRDAAPIELDIFGAAGVDVVDLPAFDLMQSLDVLRDADALTVGLHVVTAEVMNEMPKCRIICRVGTGVDAIDVPAATERGIWVTNVPDYSIDEVSSHAIALTLALARRLFQHRDATRNGDWRYMADTPIRRLAGQTLGVLGLGRIGSASARKGRGLGLNVIAYDPFIADEAFAAAGATKVDFETLLRESDYLTLHVPLTASTRHIIDAAALDRMRPTAFLVNTARGEVVDVDALIAAVQAEQIAGAAIDVLPVEPAPPDHPIFAEERIIVTPHIAWASAEAGQDVRIRGAEDVVRVLQGHDPLYALNDIRAPVSG